jgi:hypothetical protein
MMALGAAGDAITHGEFAQVITSMRKTELTDRFIANSPGRFRQQTAAAHDRQAVL